MLTLAYVLNFIDRQILVIIQEPIKKELLLSDSQLGLLSGFSFALVYITAGIPIAYWADRGNRRNIIVLAVTVWSGMTALSGFARSFSELLLARIGVGIGEAGGSPPAHSMISDYYPPKERATALGIYSTGVHIGVLLGFLAGGFIAQEMGWRVAFMAVGLPGILFAAVMYFTVREPERGRWETAEEAQYTPTLRETIDLLMKFRSFWFLAMGCGLTAFAGYGNGNFTPPFLMRSHGLEVGEVGVLLAVFGGGGGIIGTLLGGKLADHLGAKDARWYMWVPAIAGILALPLTFPYLLLDNTTVVMGLLFVVTILINTYLGPCIAMAHALVPPAMRSLTSAILFFVLNLIGLGMGPLTAGVLSDYFSQTYGDDGLRYAMLIVGMVASVGILMFFMAARTIRADLEAARALTHT
ncbi:MAG TPA: MFS transporter [Myxococcales bacterium]|nr:MFS transporter [Myxococcales bacterium]HIL99880.1 MFS transporter [Myxococcales bacterium]